METNIAPRPLSRLTYKIMGINLITIAVLAMSFSYITQTRQNLIANEISNFETETRMYAAILNNALQSPQYSITSLNELLQSLNLHAEQQVSLFLDGHDKIASSGLIPERRAFAETQDKNTNMVMRGFIALDSLLSVNFNLPTFPGAENILNSSLPRIGETYDGLNIAAWSAPDGGLILSADIQLKKTATGQSATLQLVRRDMGIEKSFSSTRLDVFRFAVISLLLTMSFSLYLSGVIGHPLRNLAMAAEAFRLNKGRNIEIPDLSARQDEIGELSHAMREMADALRKRLMSIEQFAADVAHELKNPITSMKSAVETLPKVKNDDDKEKLLQIIQHDLKRMDRLISDISQASRLDSELSRDILEPFDIRNVLNPLIDSKLDFMMRANGQPAQINNIARMGFDKPVLVMGQSGRLAQVFDNLISNALSFSSDGQMITVSLESNNDFSQITVDDNGVGIPESRLDKIFDRFYSERPMSEGFGMHSGLGLSIAKQIVESHGGTIQAENRRDDEEKIIGARFVVRLKVPVL